MAAMLGSLPLALTAGDPSGIGPEIALRAWLDRQSLAVPPFYLLTDPAFLQQRAASMGLPLKFVVTTPAEAMQAFADALPIVPLSASFTDAPSQPDTASAAGIIEALDRSVDNIYAGQAAAIVTSPIAKKPLYEAGFKFPGHTEYFAELASRRSGRAEKSVMMLAGPELRTVPVTIHIALSEVPRTLTTDMIVEAALVTARELHSRFGITKPRLAIAGLNPHAGEGGSMGKEDAEIVQPAVEQLQSQGIDAFGPLPADTLFHPRARAGYDVAICMYHDQALIPAKTLAFDEAVNVTLGLPFIRTSPDHGTAFDIAGKGIARADSLISALKLARQMADRQAVPS